MYRAFKFLLFILAIQRYRSIDGYAHGDLIWSRNRQEFIGLSHVSTFGAYEQEIMSESREKEKHNFQGEVVTLAYVQDYNMVDFIDNGTGVTGVCGEIWNTLAEYSNFTLVPIQTDVLESTGAGLEFSALNMIRLNESQIVPGMAFTSLHADLLDFTTPIWETRYRIYIQPEWQTDTNWIFNMFERKVCFAIFLFFLLLSLLGYLMQNLSAKVFCDKKCLHNLHDHIFYTFATLCSQDYTPDTLDRGSKILCVSKKMFSWLLLIVVSSHVISYMTNVKMHPPFEDIESLLNKTDRVIVIYGSTIAAGQYSRLVDNLDNNGVFKGPRTSWMDSQELMHKRACEYQYRNWALFELEDTMQAFGDRFCEMVAVGKSYFPILVSFGVSKGFKYKRTFDIGILKMKEFGLIDRLKHRWLKSIAETSESENLGHAQFTPINLKQVLMLFIILCIGVVASVVIFVVEVIVSIYKSNQRRSDSGRMFIEEAGLNARRSPTDNHRENRMRREIELSEISRPIYVQNVCVVDPNYSRAQDNEYPHRTFYN